MDRSFPDVRGKRVADVGARHPDLVHVGERRIEPRRRGGGLPEPDADVVAVAEEGRTEILAEQRKLFGIEAQDVDVEPACPVGQHLGMVDSSPLETPFDSPRGFSDAEHAVGVPTTRTPRLLGSSFDSRHASCCGVGRNGTGTSCSSPPY